MADNVLKELLVSILSVFDPSSSKQALQDVDKHQAQITEREKRGSEQRNKNLAASLAAGLKHVEGYAKGVLQVSEKVSLGLIAIGTSIEGAAIAGTFALARLSKEMSATYYAGQRIGASVKDMDAFRYASEQVGSSAQKAQAMLDKLGDLRNNSPAAYVGLLQRIGVAATDAAGRLRSPAQAAADLSNALAKMPRQLQLLFGNQLGGDDDQILAMARPAFRAQLRQYQEMQSKIGFDPDRAAEDGAKFEQIWNRMWTAVDLVSKKVQAAFFNQVGGSVDHITDWLVKNSGRISDMAVKVGDFALHLATSIVDLIGTFDKLDPTTQRFIEILAGLAAGFLALQAGPIGAIMALAAALAFLWDDYEKYKQGLPHIVDWDKWEPKIKAAIAGLTNLWNKFDELSLKITGQGGLKTAMEAFAVYMAGAWVAKLLGAFSSIGSGWLAMLARMGFATTGLFLKAIGLGSAVAGAGAVAILAGGAAAGAMNSANVGDSGQDGGTWAGDAPDNGPLGAHLRHRASRNPSSPAGRVWNAIKGAIGMGDSGPGAGVSGVSPDTKMSDLDAKQREDLVAALGKSEGNPGARPDYNNPGNIKWGLWARMHGATGGGIAGIAKFPDEATGHAAVASLLFSGKRYRGLSIRQAMNVYSPRGDGANDPDRKAAMIASHIGAPAAPGGTAATAQPAVVPSPQGQNDVPPIAGDISGQSTYSHGQLPDVKGLIFHHTAGRGTPEGVVQTLNQERLGVQYVIARDGKLYQTLPSGARGAHILPSRINDLNNHNSMGVEVIARDDSDVTPAEIATGKAFGEAMARKYPGLKIFGHGEVNPGHRPATEGMSIVSAIRADLGKPKLDPNYKPAPIPVEQRTLQTYSGRDPEPALDGHATLDARKIGAHIARLKHFQHAVLAASPHLLTTSQPLGILPSSFRGSDATLGSNKTFSPTVNQNVTINGVQDPHDIANHLKNHAKRGVQDAIRHVQGPSQ